MALLLLLAANDTSCDLLPQRVPDAVPDATDHNDAMQQMGYKRIQSDGESYDDSGWLDTLFAPSLVQGQVYTPLLHSSPFPIESASTTEGEFSQDSQIKSKIPQHDTANKPDTILYNPPSPIAFWIGIAI